MLYPAELRALVPRIAGRKRAPPYFQRRHCQRSRENPRNCETSKKTVPAMQRVQAPTTTLTGLSLCHPPTAWSGLVNRLESFDKRSMARGSLKGNLPSDRLACDVDSFFRWDGRWVVAGLLPLARRASVRGFSLIARTKHSRWHHEPALSSASLAYRLSRVAELVRGAPPLAGVAPRRFCGPHEAS